MSLFLLLTGMPAAPSQSTGAKCFIHSFAASLHMSVRQWLRWLLTLPAAIAAVTLLHYHADHILSVSAQGHGM
jgi:glyoxylase-like metal-dependent hydrolase (beta-lactamase superfamily II)